MNGFLSPDGKFYECNYGEHSTLAEEITREQNICPDITDSFWRDKESLLKKEGYIYFGFTGDRGANTDSYVFYDFVDMKLSKQQLNWIESNKSKMTEKQYDYIKDIESEDLERVKRAIFSNM